MHASFISLLLLIVVRSFVTGFCLFLLRFNVPVNNFSSLPGYYQYFSGSKKLLVVLFKISKITYSFLLILFDCFL